MNEKYKPRPINDLIVQTFSDYNRGIFVEDFKFLIGTGYSPIQALRESLKIDYEFLVNVNNRIVPEPTNSLKEAA